MPAQENDGNPQGQPAQQQQQQVNTGNRSPYADYLDRIPEGLRGAVEPVFKDWDANVTRMRQNELAKLQEYGGYDELVQQYEPEYLTQATQLAMMLEQNPQALYEGLAQMLGIQNGEGQYDQEEDYGQQQFDLSQDPAFQQLTEQQGQLAELIQNQYEQQQMEQEEQEVLDELDQMHEQYGDFDDEMVLMIAAHTNDLNMAYEMYKQRLGQQAQQMNQPGMQAPIVGGGGNGGVPSNVVNPREMSDRQRKEAALAIARANKPQG